MRRNSFAWKVSSIITALALAGCVSTEQARGPAPVLSGAAAEKAHDNIAQLMFALHEDAGEDADWYQVAEAGFNFVDDQCRAYFDDLFFLDRGREQVKSGLSAGAATTAALLALTGASQPSLAIAAQAFGLASSATDIVAGTYLYQLPPATTQGYVEKLQLAYRAAAAASRASINSPATTYYVIQRYLNLCLPPTIEASIAKQLASTKAIGVAAGEGPLFSVETISVTPGAQTGLLRPMVITRADAPIPRFPRRELPPQVVPDGIFRSTLLFPGDVKSFRTLVGLSPDGQLDATAMSLLKACLDKSNSRLTPANTLNRKEIIALHNAVDRNRCAP